MIMTFFRNKKSVICNKILNSSAIKKKYGFIFGFYIKFCNYHFLLYEFDGSTTPENRFFCPGNELANIY